MKGFVPTPDIIVDLMVAKLFRQQSPEPRSEILDAGCGTGAFIEGIIRWCERHQRVIPKITGIESDPRRASDSKRKFANQPSVKILPRDFLAPHEAAYDYVVGNPPYIPITGLSENEKSKYRRRYATAKDRFDLYLLFFEQALRCLRPNGRLVFITPEKFLYVKTAVPLRRMLAETRIEEIHLVSEGTFGSLVTYPTITTVVNVSGPSPTRVIFRDGRTRMVSLQNNSSSWMPILNGASHKEAPHTLADICLRISCGVATGADAVYVTKATDLNPNLKPFAYPTIAGRQIAPQGASLRVDEVMLLPYTSRGDLLPEGELGNLRTYLKHPQRREKLLKRTCASRKPWYAFHESPPLPEILRPKILCKDITAKPFFVVDEEGRLVPRHSVYYIVPKDPSIIRNLVNYLNSPATGRWLKSHCQRVANGFLRLQSHVLKRIPIPEEVLPASPPSPVASVQSGRLLAEAG